MFVQCPLYTEHWLVALPPHQNKLQSWKSGMSPPVVLVEQHLFREGWIGVIVTVYLIYLLFVGPCFLSTSNKYIHTASPPQKAFPRGFVREQSCGFVWICLPASAFGSFEGELFHKVCVFQISHRVFQISTYLVHNLARTTKHKLKINWKKRKILSIKRRLQIQFLNTWNRKSSSGLHQSSLSLLWLVLYSCSANLDFIEMAQ